MQGAIIEYKQDKGFGFIRDEKGENRFFHINDVNDRAILLNNLTKYYYTKIIDRPCYIVNFTPDKNHQGLSAKQIILTNDILNDRSIDGFFEARVISVEYHVQETSRLVQGIKKGESLPVFATAGGNGTYRMGYPEVYKDLFIEFIREDMIGWGIIEARKLTLEVNGRTNITQMFIQKLKEKLVGKTIQVRAIGNEWKIRNISSLKI